MKKLFGLISIDVTEVIKTVREHDELSNGIMSVLDLMKYVALNNGQLPSNFGESRNGNSTIRMLRKHVINLLKENAELKVKLASLKD